MSKPLSECYTALRIALGDDPSAIQPSFTNAQLDGILQSAIDLGLAPDCIGLNADRNALDPAPKNADTLGYYILKAALFVQTTDTPVNIKTRPMSVSVNNVARRDTLHGLERLIHELECDGNICDETANGTIIADPDCQTFLTSALGDCAFLTL